MQSIYVTAGTRKEYEEYIRTQSDYKKTYYYLRDKEYLRGVRNPDGIFIGSWKNRSDIKELLEHLLVVMDNPIKQKVIRDIYNHFR